MPTEHEYKYVLKKSIFDDPHLQIQKVIHIQQGYMHPEIVNLRVRCEDGKHWWFFFKERVCNPGNPDFKFRQIEIQKELDQRDGEDLFALCTKKLEKYRNIVYDNGLKWELDKLVYYGETYFVLLEVEMPEETDRPPLPPVFERHLLYEVPLTETSFSNTKLADTEYATKLYLELLQKHYTQGGKR
jgi:CYTH domain-containing protein